MTANTPNFSLGIRRSFHNRLVVGRSFTLSLQNDSWVHARLKIPLAAWWNPALQCLILVRDRRLFAVHGK